MLAGTTITVRACLPPLFTVSTFSHGHYIAKEGAIFPRRLLLILIQLEQHFAAVLPRMTSHINPVLFLRSYFLGKKFSFEPTQPMECTREYPVIQHTAQVFPGGKYSNGRYAIASRVFMFHYSFHVIERNECNLEVDFDILYMTNLQGIN